VTDDDSVDPPPKKSDQRMLAIALALAAAACFGFASFSHRWLYNPQSVTLERISFGLNSNTICAAERDVCKDMSNSELVDAWAEERAKYAKAAAETTDNYRNEQEMRLAEHERQASNELLQASSAFPTFGRIAFGGCLLAALSLAVGAVLVLMRKRVSLPIMPTTTALLGITVALITGCIFAALKPGPPGYVGVSLGFFVFGGGVVSGLASALMLNKLLRPFDPDLLEDAMNADQF
jgi:hypothetical protein